MRRHLIFSCEGQTCAATLDAADGPTAILLVSGGSEPRSGAHGWQARFASALAAAGFSVLRFDRRGVGDSDGIDQGFEGSRADIVAAAALVRDEMPTATRLIGIGNCDAASALALFGAAAGLNGAILLNPWTAAQADDLPPVAAIRARYRRRLFDPASWSRLLKGQMNLKLALRGLRRAAGSSSESALAVRMGNAIRDAGLPAAAVLASRDATALAYLASAPDIPIHRVESASHNFVDPNDPERLLSACLGEIGRMI